VDGTVWTVLRTADAPDSSIVRCSSSVARFAETWLAADRLAATADGHAHGSLLRSTARVILPHVDGALPKAAADVLGAASRDTRIFERLPASHWRDLAPSALTDRLSRDVRAAFDPHSVLNPGILGEDSE